MDSLTPFSCQPFTEPGGFSQSCQLPRRVCVALPHYRAPLPLHTYQFLDQTEEVGSGVVRRGRGRGVSVWWLVGCRRCVVRWRRCWGWSLWRWSCSQRPRPSLVSPPTFSCTTNCCHALLLLVAPPPSSPPPIPAPELLKEEKAVLPLVAMFIAIGVALVAFGVWLLGLA